MRLKKFVISFGTSPILNNFLFSFTFYYRVYYSVPVCKLLSQSNILAFFRFLVFQIFNFLDFNLFTYCNDETVRWHPFLSFFYCRGLFFSQILCSYCLLHSSNLMLNYFSILILILFYVLKYTPSEYWAGDSTYLSKDCLTDQCTVSDFQGTLRTMNFTSSHKLSLKLRIIVHCV